MTKPSRLKSHVRFRPTGNGQAGMAPIIVGMLIAAVLAAGVVYANLRTSNQLQAMKVEDVRSRSEQADVSGAAYLQSLMRYHLTLPSHAVRTATDATILPMLYPDPYFTNPVIKGINQAPAGANWASSAQSLQMTIPGAGYIKDTDFASLLANGPSSVGQPASVSIQLPNSSPVPDAVHSFMIAAYKVRAAVQNTSGASSRATDVTINVDPPATPVGTLSIPGGTYGPNAGASQITARGSIAGVAVTARYPTTANDLVLSGASYASTAPPTYTSVDVTGVANSVTHTTPLPAYSFTVPAPVIVANTVSAPTANATIPYQLITYIRAVDDTDSIAVPQTVNVQNVPACRLLVDNLSIDPGLPPVAVPAPAAPTPSGCQNFQGSHCYWMENYSGNYCYIDASSWAPTMYSCYQMDGQNGGLNESGGGAYKYADCSNCPMWQWNSTTDAGQGPAPAPTPAPTYAPNPASNPYHLAGSMNISVEVTGAGVPSSLQLKMEDPNGNDVSSMLSGGGSSYKFSPPVGPTFGIYTLIGTVSDSYGNTQTCVVHPSVGQAACPLFFGNGSSSTPVCQNTTVAFDKSGIDPTAPVTSTNLQFCADLTQAQSQGYSVYETSVLASSPTSVKPCPSAARCFAVAKTTDPYIIPVVVDNAATNSCQAIGQTRVNVGCFAADTKIRMADGQDLAIASLKAGDRVWNPITKQAVTVAATTAGAEPLPLIHLTTRDGHSLRVTTEHPVPTRRGIIAAGKVRRSDEIRQPDGGWTPLASVQQEAEPPATTVWNLRLLIDSRAEEDHFVLANGMVSGDLYLQQRLVPNIVEGNSQR